jgi:tetratricopeptide (TPR) repeat protein
MTTHKKYLILKLAIIVSLNCFGQNYKTKFQELCAKKDTIGQLSLLKEWENKAPNDPELFVSYYNHFVQKSMHEVIGLSKIKQSANSLSLTDSTGKTVGFIGSSRHFEYESLQKGFEYINKGISTFPNRLDMRFGKIYILGQDENYSQFTEEIIKTIEYSNINKNAWIWSENKPLEEPLNFMLSSIQDYIIQLYNTGDEKLLDNMKQIAETVLKFYPNHIESLSNLSIFYLLNKDYDKALEFLLKAEKINPKDTVVLNNIAQAYKNKGDVKNAIKYFELTIKYGDNQAKESAKNEIKKLKNKKK